MVCCTRYSGADAPLLSATVLTPANQAGSISSGRCTRYAARPFARAVSTSRFELDLVFEPTTRTRSASVDNSATAA